MSQVDPRSETDVRLESIANIDSPYIPGGVLSTTTSVHLLSVIMADAVEQGAIGPDETFPETEQLLVRVISKRKAGRIAFVTVADLTDHDSYGCVQLFFAPAFIDQPEIKRFLAEIHVGDIIHVSGKAGLSRTGEPSVFVSSFTLVSKCLNAFPKLIPGEGGVITAEVNAETAHDDPVRSLLASPEHRKALRVRSSVLAGIRSFFESKDCLEVETPVLSSFPGGATAERFVTKSERRDANLYMRVAPELYLKKLAISGMGNVFELGKNFRNEGIDRTHSPEFTALEAYSLNTDYNIQLLWVQELFTQLADKLGVNNPISNLVEVDFITTVRSALPIEVQEKVSHMEGSEYLVEFLSGNDVEFDSDASHADLLEIVFDEFCLSSLPYAVCVKDYPASSTPLAAVGPNGSCQKWDLYVGGMEIGTAYTENTDPSAQLSLEVTDPDFIHAVKYGMPPLGGVGLGVDRIVMLLSGQDRLSETVSFPHSSV